MFLRKIVGVTAGAALLMLAAPSATALEEPADPEPTYIYPTHPNYPSNNANYPRNNANYPSIPNRRAHVEATVMELRGDGSPAQPAPAVPPRDRRAGDQARPDLTPPTDLVH